MSQTQLYCYECRRSTLQTGDQPQQPVCPHCSSDFVEVSERPLQGLNENVLEEQIMQVFDNIAGTNLPTGGNAPAAGPVGVEDGLTMLQQALTAMAAQGAQIAVHDPNGGSLGNINFGDVVAGAGGMAAFMNQLTMLDPTSDPRITSQEFRDNLPRKKVPQTADATASPTHVAGSVCKAGDPCSVCHSEFEAEGQVVQLPCEHCFHEPCILPWLEMNHTCPICRAELPSQAGARSGGRYPGAPENPEEGVAANQTIWEIMQEHGMGQEDYEAMMNEPSPFPVRMVRPENRGIYGPNLHNEWPFTGSGPVQPIRRHTVNRAEDSSSESDDDESGEGSSGDRDEAVDGEYDNDDDEEYDEEEEEDEEDRQEEGEDQDHELAPMPALPQTAAGVNRSNAAGTASGSETTAQANGTSTASTPNATAGPPQAPGSQNKLSLQGSNSQQKSQEDSQMGPGLGTAAQRQSEAGVQEQAGATVAGNDNDGRDRRGNVVGAVAAPIGHLMRGAWHIGGSALRALLS